MSDVSNDYKMVALRTARCPAAVSVQRTTLKTAVANVVTKFVNRA